MECLSEDDLREDCRNRGIIGLESADKMRQEVLPFIYLFYISHYITIFSRKLTDIFVYAASKLVGFVSESFRVVFSFDSFKVVSRYTNYIVYASNNVVLVFAQFSLP